MSVELVTILYFGILVLTLALGMPVAFCLGCLSSIFLFWQLGPNSLYLIAVSAWEGWTNYIMIAIPMFVLMAYFLESSGLANDLFEAMYRWFGPVKGGLSIGTVGICTVFAAMAGNSSVGTMTMGLVALPSMLKKNYNKRIAVGCISAGGTLGILIPPSIPMIIYGFLAEESVGRLYMGGVMPGLIMSALFIIYILARCYLNPSLAPALPKEDRYTLVQKFVSLRALILPIILVVMVLGFIYMGVTTPTEASAIGATGAFLIVLIYRRFSMKLLRHCLLGTLRITVLAGWIIFGALLFTHVYTSMGASQFIENLIATAGVNPWFVIVLTQIILIVLGCFLDPTGIMIITIPIFIPLIRSLGFDAIWYGVLFTICLEMGYLTPPFGINLFMMKSIVPKTINMQDIIAATYPFVLLQLVGLILVICFPQIALWLPNTMIGN